MQEQLTLTERCQNWQAGSSVDAGRRVVTGVALAGPHSRNGYSYSEQVLAQAAPLYDQKPVFLDHVSSRSKPTDRSTRDLVGTISHPRFEDGRLRGDIQVLETESGQTFLQLVASGTPGVGMSHVVLARRSADGTRIESIEEVISVDVVINPATTTTFQESHDFLSASRCSESDRFRQLTHECEQLRTENQELRQEIVRYRRESQIQSLLQRSTLPASAITPLFRQQLLSAATEQACRELIADREQLLIETTRPRILPFSVERERTRDRASDDEFFGVLRRAAVR